MEQEREREILKNMCHVLDLLLIILFIYLFL